jgi:hypothetical protein
MTDRWVLAVALLAALFVAAGPAAADDKEDVEKAKGLAGKYEVAGTSSGGDKYSGTAEIEHLKGNAVTITWKIGKRTDVDRGKVEGNTLTVEYDGALKDDRDGKAEYKIRKSGVLDGTFSEKGSKKKGTEELTPKK